MTADRAHGADRHASDPGFGRRFGVRLLLVLPVAALLAAIAWGLIGAGFGILVVGAAAGALVGAVVILLRRRRPLGSSENPYAPPVRVGSPAPSGQPGDRGPDGFPTDVINYSRIRVAGIGGLGLVVMAAAVALELERVGTSVLLGLVGGALIALAAILWRRRTGPLSSSGRTPGAHGPLLASDRSEPSDGDVPAAEDDNTAELARVKPAWQRGL